jgi:hypothetical protein
MSTARDLVRKRIGIEDWPQSVRLPDGLAGIRDVDAPCDGFEPGTPAGTYCGTDGHYLCRECVHAPEQDPYDETPEIEYIPWRGWSDVV